MGLRKERAPLSSEMLVLSSVGVFEGYQIQVAHERRWEDSGNRVKTARCLGAQAQGRQVVEALGSGAVTW